VKKTEGTKEEMGARDFKNNQLTTIQAGTVFKTLQARL